MKSLSLLIIGCTVAAGVFGQNVAGTVTININGNSNRQILVDGKNYLNNTNSVTSTIKNSAIVITDLQTGQHQLEVIRTNNRNRSTTSSTTFNLRPRYDLAISVSTDGSVQLKETRARKNNTGNLQTKTSMSNADFNTLLLSVKNQTRASARRTAVADAFDNLNNYFSTEQARQLLVMINSEANRLELAKASYRSITDPENFSQLYSLLNSTANRNALADYVTNYNGSNSASDINTTGFNNLLQEAKKQWPENTRVTYLNNIFLTTTNRFSTAQARQLLQLISSESSRLQLAKTVFGSITDPANFSQLYDLFSASVRNELADYVSNYDSNNPNQYKTAMSTADFNSLVQSVQAQWQAANKVTTLNSAFSNINNYFTTSQVRQLLQLLTAETSRLQLAKASYRGVVDPANFTQLHDLFYNESSRNELAAYVSAYNGTGASTSYKTAMDDASFNSLMQQVKQQWLPGAKMSALTSAFANTNNYFTAEQSRQLIQLVSDETNRLQLAKSSYHNMTDPLNYTRLFDLLSTQASRDALTAYVNGYGNTSAKMAMADANFNAIVQDVQGKWLPGAKIAALTNVFASPDNYFSTAQARQLIQMVSDESNRLQLAKSSYRNIVDPANFTILYDLLSTQSSRDELAAYVGGYARY